MTRGTIWWALKIDMVVDSLALINQARAVLAGGSLIWWKDASTFCVPNFVATWIAVGANAMHCAV